MSRKLIAATLICAWGLGGCLSSLIPDPAPAANIYRLSAAGTSVPPSDGAMIVRIDRPTAPQALMGKNVTVSPDGQRLASAALAKWADPVPSMVQNSFFDVLASRARLIGILPTSGARTTHRAHITISNFEAHFDNGPESAPLAKVRYTVTVSDAASRNLIGTHDVKMTQRASARTVSAIVHAQDQANMDALNDIADWLETLAAKS